MGRMTLEPTRAPLQVSDYCVLPISLPPLKSFPTPAIHYLYLHPHEPKIPDPATPRSLFLVNVPIDATDLHIKHLFSTQLELPSGRIEEVQFEDAKKKTKHVDGGEINGTTPHRKNKKRKRGTSLENMESLAESDMPETWDREIHRSGGTAVVLFVDKVSMEAAIKAVRKMRKLQKVAVWGEGLEAGLPQLGSMSSLVLSQVL